MAAAGLAAPAEPALDPPAAEEAPIGADGAGDAGRGKARGRADGKLVEPTAIDAAALVAFLKRDGGSGNAGKAVPAVADDAGVAGATVVAGKVMAVGANGAPGAAGAAGACPQSRPAVMAATTARWMRRVFTIGYFLVGALVPVTRDVAAALVEVLGLLDAVDPGADAVPPEALDPRPGEAVLGLKPPELRPPAPNALGFFWKLATNVTEALRFWPLLSRRSRLMSRTRIIESLEPSA